ncbi:hypothetical protein C1645_741670 [Glomus cerebriforme]|uniref:Uncharacterized protein n=1 Tax=Glomus cerebriforme TaxID=658196 RepID=A0A397SI98_9GLOM|nr:hypothetical protein C1645_741670 [Glomus cerebriforme]
MAYKKAKGGLICNQIFMKQMRKRIASREKNIKIPNSNECFSYIIMNDAPHYKEDSSKSTRKGDYIEYSEIAKEFNMEIDIGHYLEQTVGICTRFINKDNRYQLLPSDKIMQIKDSDKKKRRLMIISRERQKTGLKNI